MNPLPIVLAELRRNPLGCGAIVALIAVSTAFGLVVSAQERALRAAGTRAAERFDIIVGAAGSPTQLVLTTVYLQPSRLDLLPLETLSDLAAEPGVKALAPVAVTDSFRGYTIVGTTAAFAAAPGLEDGRMFTRPEEAVMGANVNLPLGQVMRPSHGGPAENVLEAHEHGFAVSIVGRLRPSGTPWDRAIIVPIEAIWAMHDEGTQGQGVPAVVVTPRTVTDAYRLRAKYRAPGTTALFPAEVLLPLYALLGDVGAMMGATAMAFEILLFMAVMLIIVAVLAGRRHTVGVLRALGAPPDFVIATVWLEGALLIAIGVVAGALLGVALLHAVSGYVSLRTGLAVDASPDTTEYALLGALLVVGSLLAVLPSLSLLRRSVSGLLRS